MKSLLTIILLIAVVCPAFGSDFDDMIAQRQRLRAQMIVLSEDMQQLIAHPIKGIEHQLDVLSQDMVLKKQLLQTFVQTVNLDNQLIDAYQQKVMEQESTIKDLSSSVYTWQMWSNWMQIRTGIAILLICYILHLAYFVEWNITSFLALAVVGGVALLYGHVLFAFIVTMYAGLHGMANFVSIMPRKQQLTGCIAAFAANIAITLVIYRLV